MNVPANQSMLPPRQNEDQIDVLDWVRILWRGKWWIALFTTITIWLGGYFAYRVAVPLYTAKSSVAFETREAQVVDLESVVSGLSGDQASINTEIEVLRSRDLLRKLVQELDLVSDPEFNATLRAPKTFSVNALRSLIFGANVATTPSDQRLLDNAINALLYRLTISNVRNSYVFNISVVTTSPTKSAEIVNTLANVYILDQLEAKFEATEQATAWLSGRVTELQTELEAANTQLKSLSASTTLVSVEALEALNRQIKDSRDRQENLSDALEGFQTRLAALTGAKAAENIDQMARVADDNTLNRIVTSQNSNEVFAAQFDLLLQRAQLDVDRTTSQINSLSQSIESLEAEFGQQSADQIELQQLQREVEASRLIYEYFLGRLKETSVQAGIQKADSRILSMAAVPNGPSSPRKSRIVMLSAILGLMLGGLFVAVREMMNTGFRIVEDVEKRTGYTVVGQIPAIPSRGRENTIRYLIEKPTSAAAEAIRNLRTSVLLANVDKPPQVIMLTSSVPGEGKTTTSMALAQNFAGLGKKVLLIEGDIRKRVFNEYFGLNSDKGLMSVISGEATIDSVVKPVEALGIDVLIGEKSTANAADVFSSDKFVAFLAEARTLYDIIIIDTPPVLVVPDARVIAQHVDAILYGIEWDKTPRAQVIEGLRQFEAVGIPVAGLALLQIDPKGMKRYGYGNRYGAYSSYGRGYYET